MNSRAATLIGCEYDISDVMANLSLWPDACCFPAMTRDGMSQLMKVKAAHHKFARQSRSLPIMERCKRETPYQDFHRIKCMVQAKADLKGALTSADLFVDACFPPDRSSLTYVYSGDDKYERTVFKRPKETQNTPLLIGVGGICDEPFPWQHWKQRAWFHAALVVVSLNVRALERLLPGFRNNEQNFDEDYMGCFHFHIWRFGEWVDIVVDDYLPILDGLPLFCRPLGGAAELWGPLVEKAYAKCKKTFQSIEHGFTLDALTDLTGSVCEFFTPDLDPPTNLFHVLYKSGQCRSFMACWRNNKRLTPAGFNWEVDQGGPDTDRYLHIITAVSKFSLCGGRMEQMVRLKCPYAKEPKWQGRFSDGDSVSWAHVNSEFLARLQPHVKKDPDEYWMSFGDFRCNFGGLFIVSSTEPFRLDGFNVSRSYRTHSDAGLSTADSQWAELHRGRGRRSTAPNAGLHHDLSGRQRINSDSQCPSARFFSLLDPGSCSSSKLWASDTLTDTCTDSYPQEDKGTSYTVNTSETPSCSTSAAGKGKSIISKRFRNRHSSNEGRAASTPSGEQLTDTPTQQQQQQKQTLNSDVTKSTVSGTSMPSSSSPSPPSATYKTLSTSCLPSPRRRKSFGERLKDTHHHNHSCSDANSTQLLKRTTKANFMKKHSLDTTLGGINLSTSPLPSSSSSSSSPSPHRNRSSTNPAETYSPSKYGATPSCPSTHTSPTSTTYEQNPSRMAEAASSQSSATHTSTSTSGSHRPNWATPAFTQSVAESDPPSPIVDETGRESQSPVMSAGQPTSVHHSASEISVHVNAEDKRPRSAPSTSSAACIGNSCTSLSSLTQSSFLATRADYFRTSGHWKSILEHRDFWSRDAPSSDRTRLDLHSKIQRVHFLVTRKEQRDYLVPPTLQDKRHVMVSLLQDYRHGASTANSLTIPIGFCLYKTKHFDRDERRHISKLQLIGQVEGEADKREVSARFDLDPGGYFLVPYYQAEHHSGEFSLRVLTESDEGHTKSGCKIS